MTRRIEHGKGWYSIDAPDGSSKYYGPDGREMGTRPANPDYAFKDTSPISTPAQPSVVPATGALGASGGTPLAWKGNTLSGTSTGTSGTSGGTPLAWQGNTLSGTGAQGASGGTPLAWQGNTLSGTGASGAVGTSMEPRPLGLSGGTTTGGGGPSASGGGGESSSNQASSSGSPGIGAGAGTGMTGAGAGAGAGGANMATPNTSAGGYDNTLLQNLMKQFQTSTAASNKAGTAQYKNLMKSVKNTSQGVMGPKGTYAQANALLAGFGKSGEADIAENAARQTGNVNQDMISRGLGNTTIRSTMLGGVDRDAQRARTLLSDQLAGQRVGLLQNQAGTQMDLGRLSADSILSKQSLPPEQALYLQIMQQLARGTGAGTAAATGGTGRITLPPVYNYTAGPSWLESRLGR